MSFAKHFLKIRRTSLTYANVELIDESGKVIKESNYRLSDQIVNSKAYRGRLSLSYEGETLFSYDDNFINSCFLYRRRFSNLVGDYSSTLEGAEDYEYWLRLTGFSPARHVATDKPLYQYRLHSNSLTSALDSDALTNLTRSIRISANNIRNNLESQKLPTDLQQAVDGAALSIAPNIKRARDSDFRSIPEQGKLNVGVIYSSGEQVRIPDQISANVIVYTLTAERNLVESALNNSTLFDDHPVSYNELTEDEYRARSLMFFLSRLDYILLPSREWSMEELRYRAGLAAAAGLELRVLRRDQLEPSDREFSDLFLPAKHIKFYETITEALSDELSCSFTREYYDKWLNSQSSQGISAIVRTGIFAKMVQKAFSLSEYK